jgi:hypothetical protein
MIDVVAEVALLRTMRDDKGNIVSEPFKKFVDNFREHVEEMVSKYRSDNGEALAVVFGPKFPPFRRLYHAKRVITDIQVQGVGLGNVKPEVVITFGVSTNFGFEEDLKKILAKIPDPTVFKIETLKGKYKEVLVSFEEQWVLPMKLIEDIFNEAEWDKLTEIPGEDYVPEQLGSKLGLMIARSLSFSPYMMMDRMPGDFHGVFVKDGGYPVPRESKNFNALAHSKLFLIPQDDGSFEVDIRPYPAEELEARKLLIQRRREFVRFAFYNTRAMTDWFEERMEAVYMTIPDETKDYRLTDREKARRKAIEALTTTVTGSRYILSFDGIKGKIKRVSDGAEASWAKKPAVFSKLKPEAGKNNLDDYGDALPDTAFVKSKISSIKEEDRYTMSVK